MYFSPEIIEVDLCPLYLIVSAENTEAAVASGSNICDDPSKISAGPPFFGSIHPAFVSR